MIKNDYLDLGLSPTVNLVLAIIPFTAWILGAITRFKEGKYVATIVRVFLGAWIVWVLDIYFMVTNKQICRLLDM